MFLPDTLELKLTVAANTVGHLWSKLWPKPGWEPLPGLYAELRHASCTEPDS